MKLTIVSSKITALVVAFAMIAGVAFVLATPKAKAVTLGELVELFIALEVIPADKAAQARSVLSSQGGSSSTTGSTSSSSVCPYVWNTNLKIGSTGTDVMKLQKFLNDMGITVSASGAGSPGNETSTYGPATGAAVKKFQEKYASEILSPVGLTTGTTNFFSSSRAKANLLCSTSTGGTTGGTTAPAGTGLSVSSASQPANALFVEKAARVPFTRFTVTAGSDGDVVMNSVTVKKTGLINKSAFNGIVLLDENGMQLGSSKTLNSNHEAIVGEKVTIAKGTSKTFTVAANAPTSLDSYAGEVGGLQVVGINTPATVSGTLPINGANHTTNATLAIGTATLDVSSFDPNTSRTKEVGTTGYTFSGIRVTAGSAEDVRLKSVRWNQTGSVSESDLANIVTVVDGTSYPTVASEGGKYYTSTFGSGILIQEGFSVDVYVRGDITGSNAAGRTVFFDIDESNDVFMTGETFGYGITPTAASTASATDTASEFTTGTPFFDGSKVTVEAGSVSTISKSAKVPAQNIAINVPGQPLGGFDIDVKGEAVTVQQMIVNFATSSGSSYGLMTNITLVDENGAVVAGPVDATYVSASVQRATFSDTVTLPLGKHTYTIKGRVPSTFGNGTTVIASTDPSSWTNVKGEVTGDTITLTNTSFTMNTMTVKAAALAVSVSGTPAAQNIVAGVQGFTFANYQLDATASGEDVRFSSIALYYDGGDNSKAGAPSNMTSCQLFDGTTALNTGSNVVNVSGSATTSPVTSTFTLDNSFVVPKGTVKTLALKCNLSGSAHSSSQYQWGINTPSAAMTTTGVTSSQSVTESGSAANGQVMTVTTPTLTISKDSSSPAYRIVAGGATDVTLGVLRLRAANEDLSLQDIALQITSPAASSSANNLVGGKVMLYNGSTKVGEGVFTSSATTTLVSLTSPLNLTKDTDVMLTIKGDLQNIGSSQSGTQGAHLKIDWDGVGQAGNTKAVGVTGSGTSVVVTGTDTATDGVRIFRSFPTFAKIDIPSTTLVKGTANELYRFSISANNSGSGINLYKLTVNVATSTATTTNLKVFAYTNSGFSAPVAGFTDGQIVATIPGLVSSGDNNAVLSSVLEIPAGATYYFKVVGDVNVTASTGTSQVSTRISGDADYHGASTLVETASNVDADADDDFIWSPNATGSSAAGTADWTNGYQVSGLTSTGSDLVTISKTN